MAAILTGLMLIVVGLLTAGGIMPDIPAQIPPNQRELSEFIRGIVGGIITAIGGATVAIGVSLKESR